MAIDLKALAPKELQALIAGANAQMQEARTTQVRTVREKIDGLLKSAGLTLADVYPTRGGKKVTGKKGSVAPKYRDLVDPTKTWSGRGRQPVWFTQAIKKRGVTAESLLIDGSTITTKAPVKTAKKAAKKATKKAVKKTAVKKPVKA